LEDFESSAPVETTPTDAPQVESSSAEQPSLYDLDSAEKFKFQGREWTTKELQSHILRQEDYSRKTQEISQERKYYDNLSYDLEAVKNNPALADKFKSIYPDKFHSYLKYLGPAEKTPAQNPGTGIDQSFVEEFKQLKAEITEQKVQAINAELDAKFSKLSSQYPMADEEAVIARAQALLDKGEKLTDKVWDSLWKNVHERNQKLADKYYSEKVKKQSQANAKAKDVGFGGATPGAAPVQARTIKERTEQLLRSGVLDQ
jgi:hypothetical protein